MLVEAESSRIGNLNVPKALWRAICAAPRIRLEVPLEARAAFTADRYCDVLGDHGRMTPILAQLASLHPAERIDAWRRMLASGDLYGMSMGLLKDHYDPRYQRHRARHDDGCGRVVVLDGLANLDAAASKVEAVLARMA